MCAYRMRTSAQLKWNGKEFSLSFSFRSLSVLSLSFLLLNYSFPFYFVSSFSIVFHCSSVAWSAVRSHSRFNLCHFVLCVPTNTPAYSYKHNDCSLSSRSPCLSSICLESLSTLFILLFCFFFVIRFQRASSSRNTKTLAHWPNCQMREERSICCVH